MGGSATLGQDLIADLVPVVDEIRGELNPDFGTRPYRVFRVKRRWTGAGRGDGQALTVFDTEITPQPDVALPSQAEALKYELLPTGKQEAGGILLKEVSLTYTHDELAGGALGPTEEFYFRVTDALGQGLPNRYFVPATPPVVDRDKTIGWIVPLARAEIRE
jgi:hypothetical protein